MQIKTADLCDRFGEAVQLCSTSWRSYGGRHAASGHIQTLRTYEDAALLRQTLAGPGEGRVLVVDAGASLQVAVLGDRMARIGLDNGWAGVLIHGAVRDIELLRDLDFAVFALGRNPRRGSSTGVGDIGVALSIDGILIRPGDFIAMDLDGVAVMDGIPIAPG
ncbi:ribonuclease E activity regulator RraA [Comamonas humi]